MPDFGDTITLIQPINLSFLAYIQELPIIHLNAINCMLTVISNYKMLTVNISQEEKASWWLQEHLPIPLFTLCNGLSNNTNKI